MICNETLSLEEIRNGKNRTYTAKLECIIQFYRTYKGVTINAKRPHEKSDITFDNYWNDSYAIMWGLHAKSFRNSSR